MTKKITKNQFYQLVGLVTASVELDVKRELLADSWESIVGTENRDRFWDWYASTGTSFEKDLREKLKFDGIEIEKSKLFKDNTRKTKEVKG
ncbi:MAG: hypothetical protein ACR2LL_08680 [Nitrosopumilus sp.]